MRPFLKGALLAVAAVAIVAAIGAIVFLKTTGLSARAQPGAVETAVARRLRALAVPGEYQNLKNPVLRNEESIRNGMAHFADHCAVCHANNGSGDTEMGRSMFPPAPDMRLSATQDLSDGALFYIIEHGVRFTGMPAWGTGTIDGDVLRLEPFPNGAEPTYRLHGGLLHGRYWPAAKDVPGYETAAVLRRTPLSPATRVSHARVWLNGRDLGFYVLKEGFDKKFLGRHFPDNDGNFYDGGFCTEINSPLEKESGEGPDDLVEVRDRIACLRAYLSDGAPPSTAVLRRACRSVRNETARLLSRRHIREKRQFPLPTEPQDWIVLDGEALFYDRGRPQLSMVYRAGVEEGERVIYQPNGLPAMKVMVKEGKLEGPATWFHPGGAVMRTATYVAGALEGEAVDYDERGKVRERSHYKADLLDGEVLRYGPNGKVTEKLRFKDGVPQK